jgi:hypothetical protein
MAQRVCVEAPNADSPVFREGAIDEKFDLSIIKKEVLEM